MFKRRYRAKIINISMMCAKSLEYGVFFKKKEDKFKGHVLYLENIKLRYEILNPTF